MIFYQSSSLTKTKKNFPKDRIASVTSFPLDVIQHFKINLNLLECIMYVKSYVYINVNVNFWIINNYFNLEFNFFQSIYVYDMTEDFFVVFVKELMIHLPM